MNKKISLPKTKDSLQWYWKFENPNYVTIVTIKNPVIKQWLSISDDKILLNWEVKLFDKEKNPDKVISDAIKIPMMDWMKNYSELKGKIHIKIDEGKVLPNEVDITDLEEKNLTIFNIHKQKTTEYNF